MKENFTLRDYLTYTLVGFSFIICFVLHFLEPTLVLIYQMKDLSTLLIFLLIPLCYLIGHIVLTIDCLIYNTRLTRRTLETIYMNKSCCLAQITNFLFSNRIRYVLDYKEINQDEFNQQRMNLVLNGMYEKADYYQIMSDLFKGVIIVILLSLFYSICKYSFIDIKTLIHIVMLFITWYRSRIFTRHYVNFIIDSSKHLKSYR